ncbi:MAG: methylmalonyl-CoA mutase family protein [candidate division WOR-3 bacterium]|nr:MAG: methylmalonyl-CoA mutase family protein [candidate division WOR-3 bacterium]
MKIFFSPEDLEHFDYGRDLGEPGAFPFTRGVYPTMYTGRLWTMRQYAGYATAEESNRRYKYLLEHGQTGLSVAFDLPTQMGYDSDNELAAGEVGKTGVAIDTLEDMEILFDGIPLDRVSTSMTINATAAVLLAMYIIVAEKHGVPKAALSGTVQNDVLKEYIARGTYIYPPRASIKIIVDIMDYCSRHLPKWNTVSVSGYHIREAGATAVQELAFTIANGMTYVEYARDKARLDIDRVAPRISFFFNAHNDFFEEIAKFRAGRRIWARIMRDRLGARNPKSWMMRFHTQTAGCTLTVQEPDNNAVRVAFQALAAVLGGTQSLHTNSRDEALALPSEESVKLALRTQQIVAYETGIPAVVDPLGGSYYIEALTDKLEAEVNAYLETIEEMGGALAAIEQGFFQQEIHRSAYEYQKAVERGDTPVVGVNKFVTDQKDEQPSLLRVSPGVVKKQLTRLQRTKQRRNNAKVKQTLEDLRRAAEHDDNIMEPMLESVRSYATIGEISDALCDVFGRYEEKKIL